MSQGNRATERVGPLIPGPTQEELEEMKRYDAAWAEYETELKVIRGEHSRLIEQARQVKRAAEDAAWKQMRERTQKALNKFREATGQQTSA